MLNKVTLIGRLGKKPEMKDGQYPRATFSVATTRRTKNGDETDWHYVTAWGKQAAPCVEYLDKGSMVCVEGEIGYYKPEGSKISSAQINAQRVHFLGQPKNKQEDILF